MTPVQFAHKWCAQYQSDGSCLQAKLVSDDGKRIILKPLAKCVLATAGKRCVYFEEAVLPQNFKLDPAEHYNAEQRTRLAKCAAEQEEVSHVYRMATGTFNASRRKCPRCETREVVKGFKFCPVCAEERRQEATRERQRRKRAV
jgi:hypothetical protein